jgi:hypothetical protein
MNSTKRRLGRLIRRSASPKLARMVAQLDRAWRLEGKREGRVENALAWRLGQLSGSPGGYGQGRRIQILSANLLGQTSGWEDYHSA